MKGNKEAKSEHKVEDDLENVLEYKLKIDFSKLVNVLRETRKQGEEIYTVKTAVQGRLQECLSAVDQVTVR